MYRPGQGFWGVSITGHSESTGDDPEESWCPTKKNERDKCTDLGRDSGGGLFRWYVVRCALCGMGLASKVHRYP